MKILLVRHGETDFNNAGIIQGQFETNLTRLGKAQAAALGQRLKNENIDAIFSSDLKRAKATTKEINRHHGIAVTFCKDLRERDFGEFVGQPRENYDLRVQKEDFFSFRPIGGESLLDLQQRIKSFLEKLAVAPETSTVLISAHRQTNRMILKELSGLSLEEWFKLEQDSACLNILKGQGLDRMRVVLLNSVTHCRNIRI